ncbi:MAG: hypothetical protein RMI56_00730 [Sulfolobales archaeon]|nr:hypothetical protein [Sulfolobales archaeon]MDW8082305.1 hypothetical protein [Sulfolobales archaeon]
MKIPLMLVLYGLLFVALVPLLIRIAVAVGELVETYFTTVGSALLSLAIAGFTTTGALYTWIKIAKWIVSRKCREYSE